VIEASLATQAVDDGEALNIHKAKARDPEVWASWYDQYHPLLYRYAISRLNDREEAADIASQVFLEALKGVDRSLGGQRPGSDIARNLVPPEGGCRSRWRLIADREGTAPRGNDNIA
jgi:hypothetical protein